MFYCLLSPLEVRLIFLFLLMVSTASRVGTGNIVGVSSAICLGGYGAVFWMWVTALLGAHGRHLRDRSGEYASVFRMLQKGLQDTETSISKL